MKKQLTTIVTVTVASALLVALPLKAIAGFVHYKSVSDDVAQ